MTPRRTLCTLLLSALLAVSVAPPRCLAGSAAPGHQGARPRLTTLQAGRPQLRSGGSAGTSSRWQEETQLSAGDGQAGDHFGGPVALSGDTAVVGAWNAHHGAGAAYVFVRTTSGWTQQATLAADSGNPDHWFGVSVALSGDTALIGAPMAGHTGEAYIFVRHGRQWTEQARLSSRDGAPGDWFGRAVALYGDSALVGAWYAHDHAGAAYVFTRTAGRWSQQAMLTADKGEPEDYFGTSVALHADMALVGAAGVVANTGSAFIFTRQGVTWKQQARLSASDGMPGDVFGMAVALTDSTALVGAGDADCQRGAAYIFVRTEQEWTQQARLRAADGACRDRFGHAVALSGNTALVGAWYADDQAGAVYVFTRAAGRWAQQARLTAGDGGSGDWFGGSVAESGGAVLVGAGFKDRARGVVCVFTRVSAA